MGDFGAGKSSNPESSFSSRHIMPTISEIGTKRTVENSPGVAQFNEDFPPMNSWNDILKCNNASSHDHQIHEGGDRPTTMLSHHLSLPKTSNSEFSSMKSLLTDSVPWKIRAKRGFATHPRSIAERVRRTKISERMRKLQELVPNMEKQTNTADMLDLAVDYIKDLQAQVKKLSDNRAKCSCLAKGKS
ncbi:hypothetical protein ACJIZ3_016963 [Penstemon smallii]|uniref:BHLH domain-containing protein n=1 Tax=Penstemon smallii TaxID=265156 RepID=A0ABD3SUZ2_9LAMI